MRLFYLILILIAMFAAGPAAAHEERVSSAVLFVADGLGWGHLQIWLETRRLEGRPPRLEALWREGHVGVASVRPIDALVPESAGGASLLATGEPARNRAVSWGLHGERPATLLERARAKGLATGLVSTGRLTHAVPASFLAHAESRDPEAALVEPVLDGPASVLLGGGSGVFGEEGLARAAEKGWTVVREARALSRTRGSRVLGLFAPDYFPYAVDRGSGPAVPRLVELVREALRVLSASEPRLLLVVDARLIDEASHNNDLAAVLAELDELDEAVGAALDSPDAARTLVVLTSPHDTGGPAVVSAANPLDWTAPERLRVVRGQMGSFRSVLAELRRRESSGAPVDARAVREAAADVIPAFAQAPPGAAQAVALAYRRGPKAETFEHGPACAELARQLETVYRIRWLTGTHSNLPVPLFARGPGAQRFAGWLSAEEVSRALAGAIGL